MNYNEKKQALANIVRDHFKYSDYENIGTMFFVKKHSGCVLRDVVYYCSLRHGLEFEVIMLDSSYFVGNKKHALALKEALGGKAYPTEFCHVAENPRELWAWEGPLRQEQCFRRTPYSNEPPLLLDIEEIKTILF